MPEKAIILTGPKSDEGHRWCRVQSECRSGTDVERRQSYDTGTTDTLFYVLRNCGRDSGSAIFLGIYCTILLLKFFTRNIKIFHLDSQFFTELSMIISCLTLNLYAM